MIFCTVDYYTADDIACLAGVHSATIHHWRRQGKFPSESLKFEGNNILFRASTINGMIEDGELSKTDPRYALQRHDPDVFREPDPSELIRHINPDYPDRHLDLLPEHYAQYLPLYERQRKIRFGDEKSNVAEAENDNSIVAAALATKSQDVTHKQRKGTKPVTETYTTKELAKKLGIPWQTVASWKRYGTISPEAIIPNSGLFEKPVIDRMISEGTLPELPGGKNVRAKAPPKIAPPILKQYPIKTTNWKASCVTSGVGTDRTPLRSSCFRTGFAKR